MHTKRLAGRAGGRQDPAGPARNRAWGEIDRLITEKAAEVPWLWGKQPLIASKDVRAVATPTRRHGISRSPR